MNKKIYLLLGLMFLFSMAFVSAESLGTFQQGTTFNLTNYCQEGGCTEITLTTITYPNGSTNYINEAMVFLDQQGFYEFNDSETLGVYSYCTLGSNSVTNCAEFTITPSGKGDSQNSIFFVVVLVLLYGLTLLFFFQKDSELAPFVALSGMALGTFGIYMVTNGLIIYRDWFTNYLSYLTIGIGFGLGLWALIEWISNEL